MNQIVYGGETPGSEPSKYRQERKSKRDSLSSGERTGKSPNRWRAKRACVASSGLRDPQAGDALPATGEKPSYQPKGLGRPVREGENPVGEGVAA